MRFSKQIAAVVATYTAGAAAQAAILADYRFSSSPVNSQALVTPSTAGPVTLSGGLAYLASIGNPAGGASVAVNLTDGSGEAGAIGANDYLAFTLTPNPGNSLDWENLKFDWVIQRDANPGNTDPNPWTANAFLKSSIGGFAATDPTLGSASRSTAVFGIGNNAGENPWQTVTFDLAALPTSASAVTFRLYVYDNGSYSGSRIRLDNIVMNGTAAVPEPASVGIVSAAALLLFRRRR